MVKMNIPICLPYLDQEEVEAVKQVITSGWLVQGPKTKEFEELFKKYTNSKYAIAVSSCTTALHLSLEALEVINSKVIVPSFTFIATANSVEYTNSEVVFCDINLYTFNIEEKEIVKILEIQKGIKAVIPVNLFGLCANLPEIVKIANSYGIKVVEDCACSFGGYINGIHSGNFGDTGCFSFHPRKAITTGEGGMIITNNEEVYQKIIRLRNHGAEISDYQRHVNQYSFLLPEYNLRGYNYRMTDIQASIGICQLKKASYILERREQIANKYIQFLRNNSYKGKSLEKYFRLPTIPEGYTHGYQSFVCIFCPEEVIFDPKTSISDKMNITTEWNVKRNQLMYELEKMGISTRQGTHAVHTLGYYKRKYDLKPEDYINSYIADRLSIALPLYPQLNDDQIEYICNCLLRCMDKVI
ncbi:MAG: DegT/DnrJ/EryC1/StrS family aminotransferase [bacterium]